METPTQEPTVTEAESVKVESSVESQPEVKEQSKSFDPSTISPEVKAYFDKQYDGYERHKAAAQEYEGLLKTKEFQEFYQGLRTPKAPEKFELTDEQFTSALSSKEQFMQLVSTLAKNIASQEVGPKLAQTQAQLDIAERKSEIAKTAASHPDFWELDKKNLIEPYLRKYPGISIEDAYKLGKSHVINEEIDRRARGLVETKKASATERPSNTSTSTNKVHVKTELEAMEIAWNEAEAGRPVPEFVFD